jgi:hypothetical protein
VNVFSHTALGAKVGERVTLEDYDKITQERAAVLNPKHLVLEKCGPLLLTNDALEATFNGKKWLTSDGTVKAQTLKNSHIS